ncbi:chromosome partitioning protein ParA [Lactobacillus amylovorus]|uniref:chromosome partitioning protein ParA n=1 Tax=Lactobacillus amylovorus TaxID=1604 RepID=UPI00201D3926|nr:chromosome partitioning protein ParA [Lactobacillus amylovorus]
MKGTRTAICDYITQVVDARLAVEANDQSSISHSYVFLEEQSGQGLLFVLRYPSGMKLDAKTYFDLYDIIAPAISKEKTMIRPLTFQLVPIDNMPIETSVGFFFPWRNGRASRLVGSINEVLSGYDLNQEIPIMKGMTAGTNVRSYLITGNTGSGKTEAFKYFEQVFSRTTNRSGTKSAKVIIFDSKKGAGSRWAKRNNPEIELIVPKEGDRPEDYIPRCNRKLEQIVSEMNHRQDELYNFSNRITTDANELDVPPIWVMFEEFEGVTLGMSPRSSQIQDLYRLLTLIALLGRESLVGLCITSQIARNDVIPIPIRSQMLVKILLGVIDSTSTAYLFGDLSDNIPLPIGGKGSGIISINDGYHYGIEPVEMPTIY